MRKLKRIIIHCSATKAEWMEGKSIAQKTQEIRRWHTQDRGWSDIGYHILIDRDGTRAPGRPIAKAGAHTRGHNRDSIGVCLIGGHGSSETDYFLENYTPAQEEALRSVLKELQAQYGKMSIHGHNEYAAKACPGFQVSRWLKKKKPQVGDKVVKGEAATAIGVGVGGAAAAAAVGVNDFNNEQLWMYGVGVAALAILVLMFVRAR